MAVTCDFIKTISDNLIYAWVSIVLVQTVFFVALTLIVSTKK